MTFKVGDRVRFLEPTSGHLVNGQIYTVRGVRKANSTFNPGVYLEGFPHDWLWWYCYRFELVEEPKLTPHKHAAIIKAWADGVAVEAYDQVSKIWYEAKLPYWRVNVEYRIKPEKKADVVIRGCARSGDPTMVLKALRHSTELDNLELTFDGETGKLKAVQILS